MKASDVPAKFPIAFGANSAPGDITYPIPTPSQSGIDPIAASLYDGFPPATFAAPNAPYGKDFQGILKMTSLWDRWFSAGAPVIYDSSFQSSIGGYPQGAIIASANLGNFWFSQIDDNTSNPDTGGANWIGFTPLPTYAADSGTANAVIVAVPQAVTNIAGLRGRVFTVTKAAAGSTAAVTMTVNGVTGTASGSLVRSDGSALTTGDLPAGVAFTALCDGTKFLAQSAPGTAAFKDASNPAKTLVASVNGATTVGHLAVFADTAGTVSDGGAVPASLHGSATGFQTFTNGATITIGGISGITKMYSLEVWLQCQIVELGYALNGEVPILQAGDNARGVNIEFNTGANQLTIVIASGGIQLFDVNTNSLTTITPGNWKIEARFIWS